MTQDLASYREPETRMPVAAARAVRPVPAPSAQDFADALLAALTQMAALSPRRQADVAVAMRRAGLAARAELVAATLEGLQRDGCVEPPLMLSDGGILVSVTVRGIEHLATTAHRHAAAGLITGALG